MKADSGAMYAAFKAKDARFDGRFFVGISSTGIYCRPVCRARQPKKENCTFYRTAAEAEYAGFRPCLLCRPELAPGASVTDASADLAFRAAGMLEENCGSGLTVEEYARRLGCTGRHLRRVFIAEYGVTPVRYLQTCRLLLAKNLLTDTALSVLDAAMAAGFGSLRRFNDLFKNSYNMPPTVLRERLPEGRGETGITLSQAYRPPYRWEELLRFLSGRTIEGVDLVKNGRYLRTARMTAPDGKEAFGWIQVANAPEKNALTVTLSDGLLPVLPQVLARVRQLFDLRCDPEAVFETLSAMNSVRLGICVKGIRLPGSFDAFEMAVRAVLGQQITVKVASTLAGRIAKTFGTPIKTGIEGLTHLFPSPRDILALNGQPENHLGPLGVISSRARTIYEIASALSRNEICLNSCALPEEQIIELMKIRGVGSWTARYIAMRALGWTDAFPETDAGIKKAFPDLTPRELAAMAERWSPWRSYAAVCIWNSL